MIDINQIEEQLMQRGVRVTGVTQHLDDLEVMLSSTERIRPQEPEGNNRMLIQNRDTVVSRVRKTVDEHHLPITLVGIVDVENEPDPHYARMLDMVVPVRIKNPNSPTPFLNPYIAVALKEMLGIQFVYSGWGFLAESDHAINIWENASLTHVGPTANTVFKLGDKVEFRKICDELQIPIKPGTLDYVRTAEEAEALWEQYHPMMISAARGGGGMGKYVARDKTQVRAAFDKATSQAQEAFGDGRVLVEQYLVSDGGRLRHIEVQFVGDGEGNIEIYGDRDCSVQSKYKKLIEIGPAVFISQETRNQIYGYARLLGGRTNYRGAGTFEFIVRKKPDGQEEIYALEINTRLQVEHPVTEQLTGIDLVHQQLKVAMGERPESMAGRIKPGFGYAMEIRILAEYFDGNKFIPCPNRITALEWPTESYVRVECAMVPGSIMPQRLDSTIGRMIVSGTSMEDIFENARKAVNATVIEGLKSTTLHDMFIPLFNNPAAVKKMLDGDYSIDNLKGILPPYS